MPVYLTVPVQESFQLPATLIGHWDFSDASTLFQDTIRTIPITDGGSPLEIKGVTDKTGNGNHLEAPVNGPLYSTNIKNGLSVADNTNGDTTAYLENSLNVGSPHAFIVVARTPATIDVSFGNSIISSSSVSGPTTNIQLIPSASRYYSNTATFVNGAAPTANTWTIWVFDMDGVNNPVYIENTLDVNNTAGALSRDHGLRFMHDDNLGAGEWDSYCAECLMFDGAISTVERLSTVAFLKDKWDI